MPQFDIPTTEEIGKMYSAMLDSVQIINDIIDTDKFKDLSQDDKNKIMQANVDHLAIMITKPFWGSLSLTEVNSAIKRGREYLMAKAAE